MLQQTQIDTALPYFARWLERWPDFPSLAAATQEEVVKAWEGLGYYNRARNLHKLAQIIVALPAPPRTADSWLALPGVGPYTAAAIASIACNDPAAVVDGNVVRVLSRLTADERLFKNNGAAVKALHPLAQALVNPVFPGDHNQAMMELGATVCYRQNPLCTLCPVQPLCLASSLGNPGQFPRFAPRITEKIFLCRLWLVHEGRILLHQRDAQSRRLAGMFELPLADELVPLLLDNQILARKRRAISHQQIEETIYRASWTPSLAALIESDAALHWIPLEQLSALTLSGPHRKWISELLTHLPL